MQRKYYLRSEKSSKLGFTSAQHLGFTTSVPTIKPQKKKVPNASETHTRVMWATGVLPVQGHVELLLWLLDHRGGGVSRFLIRADRGVRSRKHTGTHQTGSQPPLLSAGASGPGSGCRASDPSAFWSPLPGRHPALRSG